MQLEMINIYIDWENDWENYVVIMTKTSSKFIKSITLQVKIKFKRNTKKIITRHIITKEL